MISLSGKPYTRWWWFSGLIEESVIRFQLDWLKENNFGGVEIAWVYALPDSKPGPLWLSDEWIKLVAYAKEYATGIGLGCDFTFGTAWPFGGSIVDEKNAARNFRGLLTQRLEKSWENPTANRGFILNHLDKNALNCYSEQMGKALKPALKGQISGLFCDSWEVETEGLWTEGLEEQFKQRFGYDIMPYQKSLQNHPDITYDYRKIISDRIINEFYKPFTDICHKLGAYSRVQCHGSPTDLISAYSTADIPESETLLFDSHFSQIAASAAMLAGKKLISCEAFACLYGWKPFPGPGPYHKQELITDLKIIVDSLFANGVNFLVWHGMPYNSTQSKNQFYATVHVGQDANFADKLAMFNQYIEDRSVMMRAGKTYGDIAVYMPLEDNWMRDRLPDDMLRPSARYYWELQYQRFPLDLVGHRPIWINGQYLKDADYDGKFLHCSADTGAGTGNFQALYIDSKWLDIEVLMSLLRLAAQGLPICIKRKPSMPGHIPGKSYSKDLNTLFRYDNVHGLLSKTYVQAPLIQGRNIPEYWCRQDNDDLIIFFAHPKSKEISFPMHIGQSFCSEMIELELMVNWQGKRLGLKLEFFPYQSLGFRIDGDGQVERFDTTFEI